MSVRVVGIPCDRKRASGHAWQRVAEEYVTAIRDGAGCVPLLIPSVEPPLKADDILNAVDGLLLTGSVSNVAPHRYGGHDPRDPSLLDEARDATSLPLIAAAIAKGVPTLCICRGFQELNVALGGTLHQHIHERPGAIDHRERESDPYGPAHMIAISPGGLLAHLHSKSEATVNSLHSQGVNKLAPGLRVEATAPDGAIEAVSLPAAKGFLLGVQWHPEWEFAKTPLSVAIFKAFGAAIGAYSQRKP